MRSLTLLALLFIAPAVNAEDWPGWLGPRRDGSSTDVVPAWKDPLKVAWKKPVAEGHSSPVVSGKTAVLHTRGTMPNTETVTAFNAATGDTIWSKSYGVVPFKSLFGGGPRGTPTIADGKVYTFGITGVLTCFNLDSGEQLWQVDTLKEFGAKNLFFGTSCSPLVAEGKVFVNVGGKGASLVAFDAKDGKVAWKGLDDSASYSSPILLKTGDSKTVVFLTGANLVGVDPADGKVRWTVPFKDKIAESSTTPVVAGDVLFGSSITLGSTGLKLKGDSAEKLWMEPGLTCYFSTPVAVKDNLYIVTGGLGPQASATLRCIDPTSGKELWQRGNVGKYHASLIRTGDNKLLMVEEKGDAVLLDPNPKEYRELARSKICGNTWAHPGIAGGKLYLRDNRELVCVELPTATKAESK